MNTLYRLSANFLLVALSAVSFGAGWAKAAPIILKGRIAFSHDGNRHDTDDWAASTMDLLLLSKAGAKSRLVHFDHCNHYCGNTPGQETMLGRMLRAPTQLLPCEDAARRHNQKALLPRCIEGSRILKWCNQAQYFSYRLWSGLEQRRKDFDSLVVRARMLI